MNPRLPPAAAAKLQSLAQAAADSFALRKAASDAANELRDRLFRLRNSGGTLDPEQIAEIDRLEAAIPDAEKLQARRSAQHNNHAQIISRIQSWLRSLPPGAVIEAVKLRKPQLRKNETHKQAAEAAAAVVEQAQRELQILQAAPLPVSELKEYAQLWVIERARRGAPRISADRGQLHITFADPNSGGRPADDFVAFQCWLEGPKVLKRLHEEISAMNLDDSKAVSGDVRIVKIRELEQRIDDCERLEEQHTELAHAEGVFRLRRRSASPAAILGAIAPQARKLGLVA